MATTLDVLRSEHQHLLPHIEDLRATAASIGRVPREDLIERVNRNVSFLRTHLIPHARAEDDALYPIVAELLGGPDATATMRRDHVEVLRLTEELDSLRGRLDRGTDAVDEELRRVLYGLHAVVRLHFAKEEEVYVPLLEERLSPEQGLNVVDAMEVAHRLYT